MDALQGKVDSIEGELRQIGDTLRDYLDSGQTPARKVKPPGTKAGRELLQHLLGRLEQVSSQVGGLPKWSSGLTPLPTGPDTPLSYGSPAGQQSQSPPSQLRDTPRDTIPSPSPAALPRTTHAESPAQSNGALAVPVLSRTPGIPPPNGRSTSASLLTAAPLLSDHASPLFPCTYKDVNVLHEDLFEEFSRHPTVRDRGYFKLDVQDLPPLNVDKMARPTKDHATSFRYKTDSRGLIKVDTGARVNFKTPRLPFPRSAKAYWSLEEQKDLWNSTALDPPKGSLPYIIGNPLFEDVELSPGEKLLSRGRTKLEGINTQYVYFNLTGKTITTMHREDAHVRSENLLRSGANKFWCFVKPSSTEKMEAELRRIYPSMRGCSQSVRHLSLHIPPFQLDKWGVEYTLDYCVPGQAIVTEPGTYHQVLNLGPNYAIAINVEYLSSPDFPIDYTFCDDNCPDKFAMSPEDFLIYPKALPNVEPAGKRSTNREETEDAEPSLSKQPSNAPRVQKQTPIPLPKQAPKRREHIPSGEPSAEVTSQVELLEMEPLREPTESQQPQQLPTKEAESDVPVSTSPSREHPPQSAVPHSSSPAADGPRQPQGIDDHHGLAEREDHTATNAAERAQRPLQHPVAAQVEPKAGAPVFTAKRAQVLANPVPETQFQGLQQFQPVEVLRPPETRPDWNLLHGSEPPIPPRPAQPKNPFSQPPRQSMSVPSLPPTPVYASEQFLPYSNPNSPAPSPFQQDFFPTPRQNPGLYRPGGGFSPKTVPSAFRAPRPASPPPDRVAQAAAALASMPNGSRAAPALLPPVNLAAAALPTAPLALPPASPTVLPSASPATLPVASATVPPPASAAAIPPTSPAARMSAPLPAPSPAPRMIESPIPLPVFPAPPKPKKRPAATAAAKRPTKKQKSEPASNLATTAATPLPAPVFEPAPAPVTTPATILEAPQSCTPMAAISAPPVSPNWAVYQSLALMVQGGGKTKAEALSAGLVDGPASRKAAFHRLEQIVKEWRMITLSSVFPEGIYGFIAHVDNMAEFNTPIYIFLRRLIRMKMAALVYDVGNSEEESRDGTIGDITSLLGKLGWEENSRGKLQRYIREGKCWKTICNNDDGMLCIMPLNTDLSDLAMFQEELTRFQSQLNNAFTAALATIGRQLVATIWEGRELTEFVWENHNTVELSPADILPLLQPYATITTRKTHYNMKEHSNAPRPVNWSESYPWPSDPAVVKDGERHCNYCKRKKGCQCSKKRMPDVPRVEIDGSKGAGIRSRGEHQSGELLGELLGDLVVPGSYPNEWTLELRRPDMADDVVAEIYPGRRGNWVRKVNHSIDPTAQFKTVKMSGRWRVVLELLRDVNDGEEITAKFGRGYVKGSEHTVAGLD